MYTYGTPDIIETGHVYTRGPNRKPTEMLSGFNKFLRFNSFPENLKQNRGYLCCLYPWLVINEIRQNTADKAIDLAKILFGMPPSSSDQIRCS